MSWYEKHYYNRNIDKLLNNLTYNFRKTSHWSQISNKDFDIFRHYITWYHRYGLKNKLKIFKMLLVLKNSDIFEDIYNLVDYKFRIDEILEDGYSGELFNYIQQQNNQINFSNINLNNNVNRNEQYMYNFNPDIINNNRQIENNSPTFEIRFQPLNKDIINNN